MDTNVSQASWLVLLPQLPAKPDYLRVKLQRRMQRLGAVSLKHGVYALPLTAETSAASERLRAELVREKADLIVFGSVLCAGMSDADIRHRFAQASVDGYQRVAAAAKAAIRLATPDLRRLGLERVRKGFEVVRAADYFANPHREEAEAALALLESSLDANGEP